MNLRLRITATTLLLLVLSSCSSTPTKVSNFHVVEGDWVGEYHQHNIDTDFLMLLTIARDDNSQIIAVIRWPTIQDTTTIGTAKIVGNKITWIEKEIAKGTRGALTMNGKYEAKLSDIGRLTGTWMPPTSNIEAGRFTLRRLE